MHARDRNDSTLKSHQFPSRKFLSTNILVYLRQLYLLALLFWDTFFCDTPPRALKCLKLFSFEKETPSNPDGLGGGCGRACSIFLCPGLWRRGDRPDRGSARNWVESGCSVWPCQYRCPPITGTAARAGRWKLPGLAMITLFARSLPSRPGDLEVWNN